MIDPECITNYNLSEKELQEHILFWVCAAGKNGRTAAKCLDNFLEEVEAHYWGPMKSIFIAVQKGGNLPFIMRDCGIGCYMSKARTFLELSLAVGMKELDIRTCSAVDIEKIYGIGMKTSRCFILHSRKGARYAGLDTHLLKFLRELGYNVPKSTPTGKKYLELEQIFLNYADKLGKTPADLDLEIWNKYSVKPLTNGK